METETKRVTLNAPQNDERAMMEDVLVKNINHCMSGFPAELACSALVKNLEAVIIGIAKDRAQAIQFTAKISRHLKREIYAKDKSVFGFIHEMNKGSNDPILHEKKEGK